MMNFVAHQVMYFHETKTPYYVHVCCDDALLRLFIENEANSSFFVFAAAAYSFIAAVSLLPLSTPGPGLSSSTLYCTFVPPKQRTYTDVPPCFEFTEKKEKYREEKRVGVWHAINRSMQKGIEARERVREMFGVISPFISEFQHRN